MNAYLTETTEERLARLEYENDQLTNHINLLEDKYRSALVENNRLHAEQEHLATSLSSLKSKMVLVAETESRLAEALECLADARARVCSHSDDCFDFDRWSAISARYLADD